MLRTRQQSWLQFRQPPHKHLPLRRGLHWPAHGQKIRGSIRFTFFFCYLHYFFNLLDFFNRLGLFNYFSDLFFDFNDWLRLYFFNDLDFFNDWLDFFNDLDHFLNRLYFFNDGLYFFNDLDLLNHLGHLDLF